MLTVSCIGLWFSNGVRVCVHACVCVWVSSRRGRDRVSASIALVVVISMDGGASDRLQ